MAGLQGFVGVHVISAVNIIRVHLFAELPNDHSVGPLALPVGENLLIIAAWQTIKFLTLQDNKEYYEDEWRCGMTNKLTNMPSGIQTFEQIMKKSRFTLIRPFFSLE